MPTNSVPAENNPNFRPVLIAVCIIGLIIFAIAQSCSSSDGNDVAENAASGATATSIPAQSPSVEPPAPAPAPPAAEELVPGRDYDPDLVFIINLDSGGVPYSSGEAAIAAAGQVCIALAGGTQVRTVQATAVADGGYSVEDAVYFVEAAVNAYCPEYTDLVG